MVVFKQYGWLGNQIFQYCALRSLMKDSELLIMVGCNQLDDLFQDVNALFVNNHTNPVKKRFLKVFTRKIEEWAQRGLIQTITENSDQKLVFTKGKLSAIRFSHVLFQQNEHAFDPKFFFDLKIKPVYQTKSNELMSDITSVQNVLKK
jgi:hypothetical protein